MSEATVLPPQARPATTSPGYWYLLIVGLGFAGACLYYFTPGFSETTYPGNTFLCNPADRFSDFTNMRSMTMGLNPYHTGSKSIYPPLANIFFFVFSCLPRTVGLALFLIIPSLTLILCAWRWTPHLTTGLRLAVITIGMLATEPFLFALDRGNLDIWVMVALLGFVQSFGRRDGIGTDLTCAFLGAAIALKLYPVLLLFLFVRDRRWLDAVKTCVYAGAFTFAAAAPLYGGMVSGLQDFSHALGRIDGATQGVAMYARFNVGLFHAGWILATRARSEDAILFWKSIYGGVSVLFAAFVVFRLSVRRTPFIESYICLIALGCLLPSLSNDYRLIQLLPIALVLLRAPALPPRRLMTLALLGLLMAPKNEYILLPGMEPGDVGLSSVINPLILLVLVGIALFSPQSCPSSVARRDDIIHLY